MTVSYAILGYMMRLPTFLRNLWVTPNPTTTVYWTVDNTYLPTLVGLMLSVEAPKPAWKYYFDGQSGDHLKCPAVGVALHNTYVLTAPMDVHLEYDRRNKFDKRMRLLHPKLERARADQFLQPRFKQTHPDSREILSLVFLPYLFYADAPLYMEMTPPFLEWETDPTWRPICGGFDIGRWRRHLEFGIELRDRQGEIRIKRGQPLAYVRFFPQETPEGVHTRVKLVPRALTDVLRRETFTNGSIKSFVPKCPLHVVYKMREQFNLAHYGKKFMK